MAGRIRCSLLLCLPLLLASGVAAEEPQKQQKGKRRQFTPEVRQRLLQQFDKNKDGKLDQRERAAAQRGDLLPRRTPDVEAGHNGAQALRRGDRLQARHTGTEHEHARRFHRACGRGHHREEAPRLARRETGLLGKHLQLIVVKRHNALPSF